MLTAAGPKVLVVTNQPGVARCYFVEAPVDAFHAAPRAGLEGLRFLGGDLSAFLRETLGDWFPADR